MTCRQQFYSKNLILLSTQRALMLCVWSMLQSQSSTAVSCSAETTTTDPRRPSLSPSPQNLLGWQRRRRHLCLRTTPHHSHLNTMLLHEAHSRHVTNHRPSDQHFTAAKHRTSIFFVSLPLWPAALKLLLKSPTLHCASHWPPPPHMDIMLGKKCRQNIL